MLNAQINTFLVAAVLPANFLLIGGLIIVVICAIAILDRTSVITIYCWKNLIFTALLGVIFVYKLIDIFTGDMDIYAYDYTGFLKALVVIIFLVYLIFKGLLLSFTGDGIVEEKLERTLYDRACKNLFGKWALVAPRGGIISIIMALLIVGLIMPSQEWVFIFIILGGLLYQIWVDRLIRKRIQMEKAKGVVY